MLDLVALPALLVQGVLVLALVAAVVAVVRDNRLAVRVRVLVNIVDGSAFDAVIWSRRGRYLVLRDARFVEPGSEPTPVAGDVLVERARVAWIQVHPGPGR